MTHDYLSICRGHVISHMICNVVNIPQGKAAIHSPYTGSVDYAAVAQSYVKDFKSSTLTSNDIYTGFEVCNCQ